MATTTKPPILIVDDDEQFRTLLRRFLEPDHAVSEAANGAEALRRVEERTPRLILTDIDMPEVNGVEFLRKLRATPAGTGLPVIVLLGTALPEDLRAARRLQASAVLPKEEISRQRVRDLVAAHLKAMDRL